MTALRIGDRVRLRGYPHLGTVAANPYTFGRVLRVGVSWDATPRLIHVLDASEVVRVSPGSEQTVPPEARPIAVGAMAGGGR